MVIDLEATAGLNLGIQILLALALLYAIYVAKRKAFSRHCAIMRIAASLQILAIVVVMLPPMSDYLKYSPQTSFFQTVVTSHHYLGVIVVVLWVYINLVFMKRIPSYLSTKTAMRLGFAFWMLSLLLGIHIFMRLHL